MADMRRTRKRKQLAAEDDETLFSKLPDVILQLKSDNNVTESMEILSDLASSERNVDLFFDIGGAVDALVRKLTYDHLAGRVALILGRLADTSKHQDLIAKAQALPHLGDLLKRHKDQNTPEGNRVVIQAAYAMARLAYENDNNKRILRDEGAIPVLVQLLESIDGKVLKATTKVLHTLASNNDEMKTQIVDCEALPALVLMLGSKNYFICREAVGVINTLAQGSLQIQTRVCLAGALHRLIKLLSSTCSQTQREAVLLLNRFAAADSNCKVTIVLNGALVPLVEMLRSQDIKLKKASSYVLGKFAQDHDAKIQVGIAQAGGIDPLVELLDSSDETLKHHGVYALYGLAFSEATIDDLILAGTFEKLLEGDFNTQRAKVYAEKTVKRLEERFHVARVLNCLLYLMLTSKGTSQSRILFALAFLCSPNDQKRVFIDNNGIDLLLELLKQVHSKLCGYSSAALCRLAEKATEHSPSGAGPSSPTSEVCWSEQHANSIARFDVTFLVEGKLVYACKTRLCASSDVFRAMLDDGNGFKEKAGKEIGIPNISFETFDLMNVYIHTGLVDLSNKIEVYDLFKATEQYHLHDLKRLCEDNIIQDINAVNLKILYKLSHDFNAESLRNACCLFALKNFQELNSEAWYRRLIVEMLPRIKDYFVKILV